jgi:uncharacterized protein YaiI (UPF0178 family)
MRILVDADACPGPVREILFRASMRRNIPIVLVANRWAEPPKSDLISAVVVPQGPDVADDRIVEMTAAGDLIITADIPLADRVIAKGATVITPKGHLLNASNIGERLSMRNAMDEMRGAGIDTGGPSPYSVKDKQRFAAAFDRFLAKAV